MRAVMTLTPVGNVEGNSVIDHKKVFTKTFDWYDKLESVMNVRTHRIEMDTIMVKDVSLYDHRIWLKENGVYNYILHMLSAKG